MNEEIDAVDEQIEVLRSAEHDLSDLPVSPRGILKRAQALDWGVRGWSSTVRVPDTFYADDSEATGARRGDLKAPAYQVENLWLAGFGKKMGFIAWWSTDRQAKWKFVSARVLDPVGLPVENYFEYRPMKLTMGKGETEKSYKQRMHAAAETATRQGYEYNDGTSRLIHETIFVKATDLQVWLDDYSELFIPGFKRPERKPRKTTPTNDDLLAGADWAA